MTNLYKEIEGKTEKEKLKKIMETADEINKTILDKAVEKNNTFAHLSHTGAKGNESQTRQILGMPGMFLNIKGQISGQPVVSSFGEGLSLSEYVSTLPASRLGTYARANSTARPGYLGKLMTSSALEEEITEKDCNTTNGKEYKVGESGAINRVLASSVGGYPKDTPVTEELMAELEKKGHKTIKVRSPLTCESEGLCQKCYGVNSYGKFEEIGMKVGIQVTQALSETGTQAAMNLFHTGGVATKTHLENTTSDLPSGIDLIEQTLFMPGKRRGEAIICESDGIIEEIKKNSLGENFVVVKSGNKKKEYRIPVGREIKVKKGQSIKKGDLITDGLRNAHKLMELSDKNLFKFRNELNDDIKSSFNSDQSDRTFEVFTRALTNMAVVTNDGGNVGLVEGDVVPLSKLEKMNNQGVKEIQTSGMAVGEILAEKIVKANFEKGRKLSKGDVEKLKYLGIGKVKVKAEKVEFEPFLKGINQLALYKNDPMTRMSFNRIDSTLKNMASHGDFSDTDSNTISSLAKGVGYGKKKRNANEWK
jgi:DNA-directed RNA polymerase subunit beta'